MLRQYVAKPRRDVRHRFLRCKGVRRLKAARQFADPKLGHLPPIAKYSVKANNCNRRSGDVVQQQRNLSTRLGESFWPNVSTTAGAKNAISGGAVVFGWLSCSYLFDVGFILVTGRGLYETFDDEIERYITTGFEALLVLAAAFLAWRFWKRHSLFIAWIGVIWVVFEVTMKLVMAPGKGLVISIIALLFSINGVRGARALRANSRSGGLAQRNPPLSDP
jgi:hypothetical protein